MVQIPPVNTLDLPAQESGSVANAGPDTGHAVASPELLLLGEYFRAGDDLIITGPNGEQQYIDYYFSEGSAGYLYSSNGAVLTAETVEALIQEPAGALLAGPAMVPDSDNSETVAHVKVVLGEVAVTRDGVEYTLHKGDPLYLGDVIRSENNGLLKIEFVDGTLFQLGNSSRIILDDFDYQPAEGIGNFEATVLTGFFRYVSGKIGHVHEGKHSTINTPTATIGIRGSELEGIVNGCDTDTGCQTTIVHTAGILDVASSQGHGMVTLLEPGTATIVTLTSAPTPIFKADPSIIQEIRDGLSGNHSGQEDDADNEDDILGNSDEVSIADPDSGGDSVASGGNAEGRSSSATPAATTNDGAAASTTGTNPATTTQNVTADASNSSGTDTNTVIDPAIIEQLIAIQPAAGSAQSSGTDTQTGDTQTTIQDARDGFQIPQFPSSNVTGLSTLSDNSTRLDFSPSQPQSTQTAPLTTSFVSPGPSTQPTTVTQSSPEPFIETAAVPPSGPSAIDDNYTLSENDALYVSAVDGVIKNDANITDASLSLSASPVYGTLNLYADGSFDYNPDTALNSLASGEFIQDSFAYTVTGSSGASDSAVVTLTIYGENDSPVASLDRSATSENLPLILDVTANDSDPDATDGMSIIDFDTSRTQGNVTLNADGTFTYTPNGAFDNLTAGASARDAFTYTIDDGHGGTDTAVALITINGENDADVSGTAGDDTLFGTAADNILDGQEGDDLLDGGQGNDRLLGGAGNDILVFDGLDSRGVSGGEGVDTLIFLGSDESLNLADGNYSLFGIEHVDLTGSGDNTLTLDIHDVLQLPDTQIPGLNDGDMVIDGNTGDQVFLTGEGWTSEGTFDLGNTYAVYSAASHSDLLINSDITVHIA